MPIALLGFNFFDTVMAISSMTLAMAVLDMTHNLLCSWDRTIVMVIVLAGALWGGVAALGLRKPYRARESATLNHPPHD